MAGLTQFLRRPEVSADYDRNADVLYIIKGKAVPGEGEMRPHGIVLRFATDTDIPTGVTVIGFRKNGWHDRLTELATLASEHLNVRGRTLEMIIREAIA